MLTTVNPLHAHVASLVTPFTHNALVLTAGPAGPWGPAGPCGPCGPVAPVGPWDPVAPCGPATPCGPDGPWGPINSPRVKISAPSLNRNPPEARITPATVNRSPGLVVPIPTFPPNGFSSSERGPTLNSVALIVAPSLLAGNPKMRDLAAVCGARISTAASSARMSRGALGAFVPIPTIPFCSEMAVVAESFAPSHLAILFVAAGSTCTTPIAVGALANP